MSQFPVVANNLAGAGGAVAAMPSMPTTPTMSSKSGSQLQTNLNAHVLVLNRSWMAIRVVNAKRAFSLLFRELAEVIRSDDGSFAPYDLMSWRDLPELEQSFDRDDYFWVNSVRYSVAVPKVIRLLGYDKLPRQQVKLNRRNIFARDANICQYCGKRFPTSELSLDHVHPRSQGGGSSWENLVCACVGCNSKKGGRTPEQANMPLIRKPVAPKRNPVITMRVGSEKYSCWQNFLNNAYWSVELK